MGAEIGTLRKQTAVLTREGGREVGTISKEKFISSYFFFGESAHLATPLPC